MMQNSKKLALGYLAQAQALLPKVGIDDHPGDGGPDSGKLTRLEMVQLHIGIAKAQGYLNQLAAQKATIGKLQTLILAQGKPVVDCVDELMEFFLARERVPEAVTLYKKYNTDGFGASKLAKSAPDKEKSAILRDGLTKLAKWESLSGRAAQYVDLYQVALGEALLIKEIEAEKEAAKSALLALTPQILADPETHLGGLISLCRIRKMGVVMDEAGVERALRSQEQNSPGFVGMGLLYLGKDGDASKAFALLNDKTHTREFPDRLVQILPLDSYLALLKRTKNATVALRVAHGTQIEIESDVRLKLLQLAESIDPELVDSGDWFRFYSRFAYAGEKDTALTKIRAKLKKELPESEKYWKSRPAMGAMLSMRQAEWAQIVESAATAEPTLALRYLPRITEPRRRVYALVALAQAEALKSLPKGDLG
jgi:hypothetical protein